MKASLGRIVQYTLTEYDAQAINKRRDDARKSLVAETNSGTMVHVGNPVIAGDKFPLVITRVWDENSVNGQVLLDGNDSLWVTSATQGENERQWCEFPRV